MQEALGRRPAFRRALVVAGLLGAICALPMASSGAAALQVPAPSGPTAEQAPVRPNILFILVDDMGFGDLSAMGNRKVDTPNIDRLASRGMLMTRFYDASPICSPSRAGFFTGRFPAELGFVNYISGRAFNKAHGQADWLDPAVPNLATTLRSAGYATGHFGKWHMGGGRDIGDAPWPTAYGFDESFTSFEGLGPRVLVSDEERDLAEQSERLGQGPSFWKVKAELTALYCDKTIDFVGRNKDRPWFAQLWLNDVHDPWAPAAADLAAVKGKGADPEDDKYLASLVGMDRTLGRLLDQLDAMGESRDTLIVFTSDNGPASLPRYYEQGRTAPGSVNDLRGRKWSNYEGGIRQPLIVAWPGRVKAGSRDETSVGHGVDLLPTLARAAGAKLPAAIDGVDLGPVLQGKPSAQRPALYWAYGKAEATQRPPQPALARDRAPMYALRDGRWKLLANPGHADVQLYDLEADPNETKDLAGSERAVRARLLAQLDRWIATLPR